MTSLIFYTITTHAIVGIICLALGYWEGRARGHLQRQRDIAGVRYRLFTGRWPQ